jgi:hypothetical protein
MMDRAFGRHTKFLSEKQKGRDHSENLDIDGKMILEWILRRRVGRVWTGFIWHRIGTSCGLL